GDAGRIGQGAGRIGVARDHAHLGAGDEVLAGRDEHRADRRDHRADRIRRDRAGLRLDSRAEDPGPLAHLARLHCPRPNSSAAGRTAARLVSAEGGGTGDAVAARQFWIGLGLVAATVLIGLVWVRREPVYALGLALAAVAFLGPATRPWYALWALIPLAVT